MPLALPVDPSSDESGRGEMVDPVEKEGEGVEPVEEGEGVDLVKKEGQGVDPAEEGVTVNRMDVDETVEQGSPKGKHSW